jgi:hypothetical protein
MVTACRPTAKCAGPVTTGLLLTTLFSIASCGANNSRSGGPLRGNDGSGQDRSSIRITTPATIVFGYNVVTNVGASPITQIRAELGQRSSGTISVRLRTSLAVDLSARSITALGVGRWPSPDIPATDTSDLGSVVLSPGRNRVEILLILSATGSGRSSWPQTVLDYHYRGHRYRVALNNGLTICSPSSTECSA